MCLLAIVVVDLLSDGLTVEWAVQCRSCGCALTYSYEVCWPLLSLTWFLS